MKSGRAVARVGVWTQIGLDVTPRREKPPIEKPGATTGIREREARIERVSRDGDDALPRTVRARARDE